MSNKKEILDNIDEESLKGLFPGLESANGIVKSTKIVGHTMDRIDEGANGIANSTKSVVVNSTQKKQRSVTGIFSSSQLSPKKK